MKGSDVAAEVTVDLASAIRGAELRLRLQDGGDEVTVRVPAGAGDGDRVRIPGHGAPGAHGRTTRRSPAHDPRHAPSALRACRARSLSRSADHTRRSVPRRQGARSDARRLRHAHGSEARAERPGRTPQRQGREARGQAGRLFRALPESDCPIRNRARSKQPSTRSTRPCRRIYETRSFFESELGARLGVVASTKLYRCDLHAFRVLREIL